jgi:hypothetical protein
LASVGGVAFVALLQGPATGTSTWLCVALGLATVLAGALLARRVRDRVDAFLPAAVLRNRTLVRLIIAAATLSAAYAVVLYAIPLLVAADPGWDAIETGLALLPAAPIAALAAHAAGGAGASRSAPRLLAALCGLSAAGLAVAGAGHAQPVLLIISAMATVTGFAAAQALLLDRIPTLVPVADTGIAIGFYNFVFLAGAAVGPAAAGGLAAITGLAAALAAATLLPLSGLAAVRSLV